MPRPCKRRRICAIPSCGHFGPKSSAEPGRQQIVMTLDEFETIRLIDLEGLNQEQCATQMDVARTTVQAIYASARAKLAECLVNEKELSILGGDYVVCDGNGCDRHGCDRHGCRRCENREREAPEQSESCPRHGRRDRYDD